MKGFKKDGKFRPTGNKSKSSLKKTDVRNKQTVGVNEVNKLIRTKGTVDEFNKRQRKEKLDREYDYFLQGMNDYGTGDVANAISFADEVDIDGRELSDLVREQAEQLETPLEDVDINYIIYDHVLQMARNKIDSVLGFDFLNDTKAGGTEFYTAGNYMATSYDYSEETKEELQKKFDDATPDERQEIYDDKFARVFLEYVDIDVKGVT